MPLAETWQPFSVELSKMPSAETRFHLSLKDKLGARFQMRNFRLRKINKEELAHKKNREKIREHRRKEAEGYLNYLRDWYPAEITEVVVDAKEIRIGGRASEPLVLAELPLELSSHLPTPLPVIDLPAADGKFEITVPRFRGEEKVDRALSRWRLQNSEGLIRSAAKWPTNYSETVSNRDLPELKVKGQKGIGGVPLITSTEHQIFELGIKHATVNVVLDALMSDTPKPGLKPWRFEGKTYYTNERFLAGKDATIQNLCRKNVIVTCILLVGNGPAGNLKHPDAEARGTFAMPDLLTPRGASYYRAAIHFLAERYSRPNRRIANWVIHNEIDQAGTWTNMGEQPLARYLDCYARSARTVYHTSQLFDPHSRVFVSLTHHWAKQSGGVGTYQVKGLLDLWSEIAAVEGEFDWGVAYHPYPRDLRNPDTWDDQDVTFDFDTPYITPKNIEVLPAYLGEDRPILLSEQGFNSPTLSLVDQKRQAAGLVYMFRKLPEFPSIEAFHLHRYQDMPDREGGLRVGLLDENGNRKVAWDTYAALETEAAGKYYDLADEILPEPVPVQPIRERLRPNVVLIVADDLGWSDTTPYQDASEDFYETPSIAKLASEGMRFTQAYSASPLCSPTRASILTGQYPGRIRLTTPAAHLAREVLDPGVAATAAPSKAVVEPETRTRFPNHYVTVAERLKAMKYATSFVGKWHLGREPYLPDNQGFDHVVGGRFHPGPPGGYFAPWPIETIPQSPEGSHIDDIITDLSIEWITKQQKAGNPFFLNLWYYSVHGPFQAKPELINKYREKAKSLPDGAPRKNPVMAAMIETLDTNVGRIAETLKDLGISENTLLVFTSDNGGNEYNYVENLLATNNFPLRNGKGNIAEGGHRVPLIAVWPGTIAEGVVNDGLVSSIDWFPTLLDVAGQSPAVEQVVDGISLLPTLKGESEVAPERAIFCHFPHSPTATGTIAGTSVRKGEWKLTRYYGDAPEQQDRLRLINLEADPGEQTDLASKHPELTKELNALISAHLEATQSLIPRKNPAYQPGFLGWESNEATELSRVDDALKLVSKGNDPWIVTREIGAVSGKVTIEIDMDTASSPTDAAVYWSTRKRRGFHRERMLVPQKMPSGIYRVDIDSGDDPLAAIRIDPSREPGEIVIHSIRLIHWKSPGEGKSQRFWDF